MQFNDLPIADGTKDAIAAMGYETPTPIQRDAIPHLLAGRDLIGRAQTGTGKTAAFGIPIVDSLRGERRNDVFALVLVPTRELANQVSEVLTDIAKGSRLTIIPIFGGAGFDKQVKALRANGPKMVVACPGRLLDLHGRGEIDLDGVQDLVLDEADRMLDMGFIHDMRRILAILPRKRRTSLWSATLTSDIRRLADDLLKDPVLVQVESATTATMLTEQFVVRVEKTDKPSALLALLAIERPEKAVVFTRTKHLAKRLAGRLDATGWSSVALQGNMSQSQRERSMAAFRQGECRILVATDVAARGLDVPDVTHVVNFDIPNEPESYVHRIGRTGRNGKEGRSFTFVQSDEHTELRDVERTAGLRLQRFDLSFDGVDANGPDKPRAVVQVQEQKRGPRSPQKGGRQGSGGPPRGGQSQSYASRTGGSSRGSGRRSNSGPRRSTHEARQA